MDGKRIIQELHRFVSIFSIRQSSFVLVLSSSFSKGWLFETRMFRSFQLSIEKVVESCWFARLLRLVRKNIHIQRIRKGGKL